jgi:hypothetical protein
LGGDWTLIVETFDSTRMVLETRVGRIGDWSAADDHAMRNAAMAIHELARPRSSWEMEESISPLPVPLMMGMAKEDSGDRKCQKTRPSVSKMQRLVGRGPREWLLPRRTGLKPLFSSDRAEHFEKEFLGGEAQFLTVEAANVLQLVMSASRRAKD